MKVNITGHNVELTTEIREFAEKKLQRLKAHEDSITSTHFTLNVDHQDYVAEAQIHVPNNMIHAKAKSHDIHTAINMLIDKLSRQLKKHKEKNSGHR